jgi:uncharacterized protein
MWGDAAETRRPHPSRRLVPELICRNIGRVESFKITQSQARRIWLRGQRLNIAAPFGNGFPATPAAIRHLGYVQIDTIHVIERCHHHILFTRIPGYRREHLQRAQSVDKSVFEYWTHALSYIHIEDFRYYARMMRRYWQLRSAWFTNVKDSEVRKVMGRLRKDGSLTIRDIDDDVLVEKDHAWASRKPSKRALQLAFFKGLVTVSGRVGMLKTYDLMSRHFGWQRLPPSASTAETLDFIVERALRTQGVVSLESIAHSTARVKLALRQVMERRVRRKQLVPVAIAGVEKWPHWAAPEALEQPPADPQELVHILSPFDPLIIQRKRLQAFFGYEHRFEAYVPKAKRLFGYFACPVLVGDEVVAAIDLKADREQQKLLIQQWTWVAKGAARAHKKKIEPALQRFEDFQLGR